MEGIVAKMQTADHTQRKVHLLCPSSPVPRSQSASACIDVDACATTSPTRRLDAKHEDDLDDELQRVQHMPTGHHNNHSAATRRSRSVDPSPPPNQGEDNTGIPSVPAGCNEHGRPSLLRSLSHSHSSQRNNSIDESGAMSSSCLSASSCSAASSAFASGSASGQLSSAVATPCSSPPPIPFDPEMLSDADDVMVRGLRASHIAPPQSACCCTSPTHSCSVVDSSPAPTITPSPSTHSCTSDPFTPSRGERERNSRKRRNSRLHASKHAQSTASAASAMQTEDSRATFKPVKSVDRSTDQMSDVSTPYSPGQNKRCHTDGESSSSSCSSAASSACSVQQIGGGGSFSKLSSTSACSVVSHTSTKHNTLHIRVPSGSTQISVETAAPAAAAASAASAAPAPGTRRPPLHSMPGLPAPSSSRASLVSVLACVLEQLFSNPNDTLPSDPAAISMFHTASIPSISIGRYLDRIAHYAECSEESLVMSFIHISRIYHANQAGAAAPPGSGKPFQLNTLSIHRLLLIAIMTSSKFFDDLYYNNAFYSKIGGVTLQELNALEVEFLALIAFDLYVPSKIYKRFYRELTNKALHPYCSCAFRELPAELSYDEDLPRSPMVDCDLHELTYGGGAGVYGDSVSTGPGGSRLPLAMPSPITPLEPTQRVFETHGHAHAQHLQQQQHQQPQPHAAAAAAASAASSSRDRGVSLVHSHLDSSEIKHADSA